MDVESLRVSANNYHKGTMTLVSNLLGVPNEMIKTCPIVVRKRGDTLALALGTQGIANDMDYMLPYIINGAFSLEVKMKYLNYFETGVLMQGHNLLTLFEDLTDDTKNSIKQKLKEITSSSSFYRDINREINKTHKVPFSWEAHKLISNSSLAFERWRYSYEDKDKVTWFAGYAELQKAFDARIEVIKANK